MKWRIVEYFRELKMDEVLERCKVFHAVWFPSIRTADLSGVAFPPEADRRLALTLDDLRDPEPALLRIFSLKIGSRETRLSSIDFESIVKRILCPAFSITPTTRFKYDLADVAFARFLDSQTRVLDFLEDQRSAVINGVAGSGKTLVALSGRSGRLPGAARFCSFATTRCSRTTSGAVAPKRRASTCTRSPALPAKSALLRSRITPCSKIGLWNMRIAVRFLIPMSLSTRDRTSVSNQLTRPISLSF
mgnify:CR=1 FL=1